MYISVASFETQISKVIVNRGKNYYSNNYVQEVSFDPSKHKFEAIVSGTNDYNVSLIIESGIIQSYDCSCPYGDFCKHAVAVLYEIRYDDHFLAQALGNESSPLMSKEHAFDDKLETLKTDTISLINSNPTDNELEVFSNRFIIESFNIRYVRDANLKIYNMFLDLSKDVDIKIIEIFIRIYIQHYNERSGELQFSDFLQKFPESLIKDLYYKILIIDFNQYGNFNNSNEYNQHIVSNLEKGGNLIHFNHLMDTGVKVAMERYISKNPNNSTKIKHLYNFILTPTKLRLEFLESILTFEELRNFLYHNIKNVSSLDLYRVMEEKYEIRLKFDNLVLTTTDIQNNFSFFKDNNKNRLINYLENELLHNRDDLSITSKDAVTFLKRLDEEYDFKKEPIIYSYALFYKVIDDKNSFLIENEGFPISFKNRHSINESTTHAEIYNYKILIQIDELEELEHYYIFNNNSNLILTGTSSNEGTIYSRNPHYHDPYSLLSTLLKTQISNKTNDEYEILHKKVSEVRDVNLSEKRLIDSLKLVDELSVSLFDKPDIILEDKVNLQAIISFQEVLKPNSLLSYYNKDFNVSTKVGISQLYFIKNLKTFFQNIENQTFQKYGKKLAFNHDINSFSDFSVDLLELLERYNEVGYIKNNSSVYLTPSKFNELIELLKGQVIIVHGMNNSDDYENYYVDKDNYLINISLDNKNFALNLTDELTNSKILITKNYDLLVNTNTNNIKYIEYTSNKARTLTHFILKNKDFKAELVVKELAQKVIPLVMNDIELTSDLNSEIKNYSILMDSYFDYDNELDIIKVKTKYFEGDKLIEDNDLSKHQVFISNYQSILSSYGIINNVIEDPNYIVNFLNADLSAIKKVGNVFISETLQSMKIKKVSKVNINITLENNLLMSHIKSTDLSNEELKVVLTALRKGNKYVVLKDNVILTSDPNIIELNKYLEFNDLNIKDLNQEFEKPIYEVFKLQNNDNIDVNIEESIKDMMDDIINFENYEVTEKPKMYDILKPYQVSGFKWLKTLSKYNLGGILADDMGLGKTLQVITYLETEDFDLSIVICPKSLIYNWEAEIKKFNASFDSIVYTGSKEERLSLFDTIEETKSKTLIITSYDTLRSDIDLFRDINFHTIILDEAQNIKTVNALRTKAVKELTGENRFVLTGTPIENSVFDLWSIFDFIMPGYLYTYSKFTSVANKIYEDDLNVMNELIQKTQPFILRRIKKDVLKELPEKNEELLYVTFDGENRKVYDAYLKSVQDKIEDTETSNFEILSDLMRLRQICISPNLYYDNYKSEQLKIEVATNLINEAILSGHKVLVFSSFVKALDILKDQFNEDEYFLLTGKTKAEDRVTMSNKFNDKDSSQKMFFISLKAGGTGLNLTGADIVIHLDPWWNIAAENQASDRAHRIGQENVVTVYKIIMKGSIEEKIIELQNSKKDLFDKMIDNSEEVVKLTSEDYLYLLS